MTTAYDQILEQYTALRSRRCIQSNNSSGAHYLLVYALMQAGIDCKGLTNEEIEGEAISYLERNRDGRL